MIEHRIPNMLKPTMNSRTKASESWTSSRWPCLSLSCSRDAVNSEARAQIGVRVGASSAMGNQVTNLFKSDSPKKMVSQCSWVEKPPMGLHSPVVSPLSGCIQ